MTEELPVSLENNKSLKDQSGILNGILQNEMKRGGRMCSSILVDRWKVCAHEDKVHKQQLTHLHVVYGIHQARALLCLVSRIPEE